MNFTELIPTLQAAVSPVVLISGVGLLILSMTNRLARVVDRSRGTAGARLNASVEERHRLNSQLRVLVSRAKLLRRAIFSATLCVLLAALLVIDLFLSACFRVNTLWLGVTLFVLCLTSLIVALTTFLQDINDSLAALFLELDVERDRALCASDTE